MPAPGGAQQLHAFAERLLATQARQQEQQTEELRAVLHMQSATQLRELTELQRRHSGETSQLGMQIMNRIAAQANRDRGPHLGEAEAPDAIRGVLSGHMDQPEDEQASRDDSAGGSVVDGSPTELEDPSGGTTDQEMEVLNGGCAHAAVVRAIQCGDIEDGDRTAGGAAVTGAVPPHGLGVNGDGGCNRVFRDLGARGDSDGPDGAVQGDGGLGQEEHAPPPPPVLSSGEVTRRQEVESEASQGEAGASGRGREGDETTAGGAATSEGGNDRLSSRSDQEEFDVEGQDRAFTYWFLFQATEDEAKRNGVVAANLYSCGVTGWHQSEPTWRTRQGGSCTCTIKLYSDGQLLDSVRAGGLRQEAEYQAQVAILSAILQCITGCIEGYALQDQVLAPEVVQRMAASLDMRTAALTSAARKRPGDVGGAYHAELKRERRARGLSPRAFGGESLQAG